MISFDNLIGKQIFTSAITKENYIEKISWGRTFVRSPINGDPGKWSRIRNLIPLLPENPADSPIIVFTDKEYITALKSNDEFAVHKALDFLGDFSILGLEVEGSLTIYRPGHYFNQLLVKYLFQTSR